MLKRKNQKYVEILDTTLRDGEQTPSVAYTPHEKLQVAKVLLDKLHVDRLEIGSARVSSGESEGAQKIIQWAKKRNSLGSIEMLGFADKGKSIDWIKNIGGKVINLLTKGSEEHCRIQLGKSPEQHFSEVEREIAYAREQDLEVNVYLEDWSGGMANSFSYVHEFTSRLMKCDVQRIMLPDTLGILQPETLTQYLQWMYSAFPAAVLDFHAHNDYGLASANSLAAVKCGINAVHTTINGLGERAGNQTLCEIVAAIKDMSDRKTYVREKLLQYAADLVQTISGKRNAWNTPIVGTDVFTQTCGVHADGDKKGDLYANRLLPERFGRKRDYALGKLSGKASIEKNLENIDMELDDATRKKILQEVVRLGDRKKRITPADLPFIISDILKTPIKRIIEIVDYNIYTRLKFMAKADIKLKYKDRIMEASASGDGGYDAFVRALKKALRQEGLTIPRLLDYEVRIPPGGKTDALVETMIKWDSGTAVPLTTIGVDSDQMTAAVEATEKMLNIVLDN